MKTLTLELDDSAAADLTRLATLRHGEPADIATQLLRQGIAVAAFDAACHVLRPFAKEAGFHSDEAIYRGFS